MDLFTPVIETLNAGLELPVGSPFAALADRYLGKE
jgi:hypothetical protein